MKTRQVLSSPSRRVWRRTLASAAVACLMVVGVSACSAQSSSSGAQSSSSPTHSNLVTLITHDNFKVPDKLKKEFEKKTGLKVSFVQAKSGPQLVNKLVLTKDKPIGDAVYGLATNDMGKVGQEKLLAPVDIKLPEGAQKAKNPDAPRAIAIDRGDVCVNIDKTYFEKKNIPAPRTFEDLAKPQYKGLFATIEPTGVTGFAFLAATIKHFGENGWQKYWKELKANGTEFAHGWTQAYENDFTQGGNNGKYPIVLSYETSPAATVNKAQTQTTTASLPDTCYQNVEYAGVLRGSAHPDNAKKVIEWLLSPEVQASIPDNMYMYPIDKSTPLPKAYQLAPRSDKGVRLPGKEIVANQEKWVKEWVELVK